jgi:pimeloyl-ACP methyl ester carboxylesterase
MNIFAVSGLGADHRVFDFLKLNGKLHVLTWVEPEQNEHITSYAVRMAAQVDITQPFILLGVSFGGLIAVEMSRIIEAQQVILISSVAHFRDLNGFFRLTGKYGFNRLIPARPIPWFVPITWLFGAKDKALLRQIIADTDLKFSQWASRALCTWNGEHPMCTWNRIHGNKDRLMPVGNKLNTVTIADGAHFMIVDRAEEVSAEINRLLQS